MKNYYLILFITISLSCSNSKRQDQELQKFIEGGTKIDESILDSNVDQTILSEVELKKLFYEIKNEKFQDKETSFSSLKSFPKLWIGVSKNSLGYFIYHIEDTFDEQISLSDNKWSKKDGIGTTINYQIRSFKKVNEFSYKLELGEKRLTDEISTNAISTFEIIDKDTLFAIVTTTLFDINKEQVGELKSLYIPASKMHLFKHIDEPNGKSIYRRVPLEIIDLEKLK